MFAGPFDVSIVKRAKAAGIVDIRLINIRDFATDSYKTVDDHPYGGGTGMILRVDVVDRALAYTKALYKATPCRVILLDPAGHPYTQQKARELSKIDHMVLICGHYEGIDERIRSLVDEEISLGDFILTGAEIPAMAVVDSIVRLLPGTLKKPTATIEESFSEHDGGLEHPQYTRPEEYHGMNVPDILLSGDHKKIAAWQKEQSQLRTRTRRPDLLR